MDKYKILRLQLKALGYSEKLIEQILKRLEVPTISQAPSSVDRDRKIKTGETVPMLEHLRQLLIQKNFKDLATGYLYGSTPFLNLAALEAGVQALVENLEDIPLMLGLEYGALGLSKLIKGTRFGKKILKTVIPILHSAENITEKVSKSVSSELLSKIRNLTQSSEVSQLVKDYYEYDVKVRDLRRILSPEDFATYNKYSKLMIKYPQAKSTYVYNCFENLSLEGKNKLLEYFNDSDFFKYSQDALVWKEYLNEVGYGSKIKGLYESKEDVILLPENYDFSAAVHELRHRAANKKYIDISKEELLKLKDLYPGVNENELITLNEDIRSTIWKNFYDKNGRIPSTEEIDTIINSLAKLGEFSTKEGLKKYTGYASLITSTPPNAGEGRASLIKTLPVVAGAAAVSSNKLGSKLKYTKLVKEEEKILSNNKNKSKKLMRSPYPTYNTNRKINKMAKGSPIQYLQSNYIGSFQNTFNHTESKNPFEVLFKPDYHLKDYQTDEDISNELQQATEDLLSFPFIESPELPSKKKEHVSKTSSKWSSERAQSHPYTGEFDVDKAAAYLLKHAHSHYSKETCGYCARYVRLGFEAGGISTTWRPPYAYQYDEYLGTIGFEPIATNGNTGDKLPEGYSPKKGDVVVIGANEEHPMGHIAMYTGSLWVSDFKLRTFHGISGLRYDNYTIWRHKSIKHD